MRFRRLLKRIQYYVKSNKPVPQTLIDKLNKIESKYLTLYLQDCEKLQIGLPNKEFLQVYDNIDARWGVMKYLVFYFGTLENYNIERVVYLGQEKLVIHTLLQMKGKKKYNSIYHLKDNQRMYN